MVRGVFAIVVALALSSCNSVDMMGLFLPTGDSVQSRFEQSAEMNKGLKAAAVEAGESYIFYVATDAHIDQTSENLTAFNDALKNDAEASFAVMLGDCTDTRDNLPKYIEALSYNPERHARNQQIFHLLGNHDVFFDGWEDFKRMIGPSVYWFEVAFQDGKDLFISLDSATGTLGAKQSRWLREFLEDNRSEYRHCVVLTHTNIFYPDNSQAGSGNMPIEESFALIDLLGGYDVSLVLQGHDHNREEIVYGGVAYTVVGAIADKVAAPEYLRVEANAQGLWLDWNQLVKK